MPFPSDPIGTECAGDRAAEQQERPDSVLALLGDIFESLPVAVVVADAHQILLVNREAELLFGYRRDDLIGQPLEILVPDGLRQAHLAVRQHYLEHPSPRRMGANRDLMARRSDGRLVPVEIALKPVPNTDATVIIAAIVGYFGAQGIGAGSKRSQCRAGASGR